MSAPNPAPLGGPASPTLYTPGNALAIIEQRIATAATLDEVLFFTRLRGEIIRQDEFAKNAGQARHIARVRLRFKMAASGAAFFGGIGLVIGGYNFAGLFVLGAGLFGFAERYVMRWMNGSEGGDDK